MLSLLVILIILSFFFAFPFFIVSGFFKILALGFRRIGVPPMVIPAMLSLMLAGSFFNIPIGRQKIYEEEFSSFFGIVKRKKFVSQGLSINVGGGVIPIAVALFLLSRVTLGPALIATGLMVVLSFALARPVPGKGIGIPIFFPPLAAALLAFFLAPHQAASVAFISGVFGVLVGADLFHLRGAMKEGSGTLSIGGAGVFDGIFLIGIASSLLAGI